MIFKKISSKFLALLVTKKNIYSLRTKFNFNPKVWRKLFDASLKAGNLSIAEKSAQNCDSLLPEICLLYLAAGNTEALGKLYRKCKFKRNHKYQIHIALLLNDKNLLVEALKDSKMGIKIF